MNKKGRIELKKDPYLLLAAVSRAIKTIDNMMFEYRAEYAITDEWDELLSELSEALAKLSNVKARLKMSNVEEK